MMTAMMMQVQTAFSRKWHQSMQQRTVESQIRRSYAASLSNIDAINVSNTRLTSQYTVHSHLVNADSCDTEGIQQYWYGVGWYTHMDGLYVFGTS